MSPAVAGMRGPQIPGFRWVRPLGQGGFADVFLYRQELPSRDVAIKVVRAQGDERGTLELHREADAMTLLAGHPSVVELHGVGTTADGRAYLVMEYCPVADLLTQVRARPMSLETALETMIKVCGVVEMFHRQGYVHRDIKPSNIMLDAYGKPVLADVGGWRLRRFLGAVGAPGAAGRQFPCGTDAGRVGVGLDDVDVYYGPQPLRGPDW